jgi:hypothetical protein
LLDPGTIINEFFTFDFTGTNTVSGCYYQQTVSTGALSNCYPMSGIRTNAAGGPLNAITQSDSGQPYNVEIQKIIEAQTSFTIRSEQGEVDARTLLRSIEINRREMAAPNRQ